jgi:hypothetical protein
MTNVDNDGFNNNAFDSFDPFLCATFERQSSSSKDETAIFDSGDHEDKASSNGDGDGGRAAADNEEEEFAVDAPNFVDLDSLVPQTVMKSWHGPLPKVRGQLQQGGDAAIDRKGVPIVSSFRVQQLEILSGPDVDEPCQNPLSGNMILCHWRRDVDEFGRGGDIFIEEFDFNNLDFPPPPPVAVVSACVSIDEIKEAKLSQTSGSGVGVKVLGVSSILSLAAGMHRVQGRARVHVAALVKIYIISQYSYVGASSRKIQIMAVWQWGYNPSGTTHTLLQSVLIMDSIDGGDSRSYDPKTLQVANGLLFLSGNLVGCNADSNEVTTMASIFINATPNPLGRVGSITLLRVG